jgi:hypothetical protein
MQDSHQGLSSRLQNLTSELRALDQELKQQTAPDKQLLQELRQAIDDVRLTAWTVDEMINARERQANPQKLLTFLASERMRRLSCMIGDLCADMDKQVFTWQTTGVQNLSDAILLLQSRITRLIARHRAGVTTGAR